MILFDNLVRWHARKRAARMTLWKNNPQHFQESMLASFISQNANTAFGKKYSFPRIKNYSEFCSRVPIFSYEDFFPWILRTIQGEENVITTQKIFEYAKSSGTTNSRSKYIPTPKVFMNSNHLKAGADMVAAYIASSKNAKISSGSFISVTGTFSEIPNSRARAGDISALINESLPLYARFAIPHARKLSLHPSWSYKSKAIVAKALHRDVRSLFGTATWMLEMLEHAKEMSGKESLHDVWPHLEVFFHGAVAFAPYKKSFDALFPHQPIQYRDVYNSAEGFFAFEDDAVAHPRELLLLTSHDVFYEFAEMKNCVPSKEAIPLSEVVAGIEYALIITTSSGLWRYMIGDTITFTSTKPYRIRIVGRTKYYINCWGEELVADNAEQAIAKACAEIGAAVRAFTAGPLFYEKKPDTSQGAHEWAIEFTTAPKNLADFSRVLDETLRALNSDYDAKRTDDIILGAPVLHVVSSGTFRTWMDSRGKLGGQNKIPVLSNERTYLEEVLSMYSYIVQ